MLYFRSPERVEMFLTGGFGQGRGVGLNMRHHVELFFDFVNFFHVLETMEILGDMLELLLG